MTLPHHLDSTAHLRGEHALFDEIRQLTAERDELRAFVLKVAELTASSQLNLTAPALRLANDAIAILARKE